MAEQPSRPEPTAPKREDEGEPHEGARQLLGPRGPLVSLIRLLAEGAGKALELVAQAKLALVLATVVLVLLAVVLVLAVVVLLLQV